MKHFVLFMGFLFLAQLPRISPFASSVASAVCEVSRPNTSPILGASIDRGTTFNPDFSSQFVVSNCNDSDLGRLIGIGLAPDLITSQYVRYSSFNNALSPYQCTATASRIKTLDDFSTVQQSNSFATRLYNTCVVAEVEKGGVALEILEVEDLCKTEHISTNKIALTGTLCYIRVNDSAPISINYRIRPECTQPAFLRSKNILPTDIHGTVSFFAANDNSGKPVNDAVLALSNIRLIIEPPASLVEHSNNWANTLHFPANLTMDIHAGKISIQEDAEKQTLTSTLFVDNRCPQNCNETICASTCNYRTPLGAEFRLQEVRPDESVRTLDQWYTGTVIPAQWAGTTPGSARKLGHKFFAPGKRYRLLINVSKPELFFRVAQDSLNGNLLNIDLSDFSFTRLGQEQPLRPLKGLNEISLKRSASSAIGRGLPVMNTLPLLTSEVLSNSDFSAIFQNGLSTLDSLFMRWEAWPPYYRKICGIGDNSNCASSSSGQTARNIVSIEFTLGEKKNTATKDLPMKNIVVSRSSNILPSYSDTQSTTPVIECKRVSAPTP